MFPNFPWTNFHRLNADWILTEFNRIKSTVEELVSTAEDRITEALTTARNALTAAQEAYNRSTANMYRLNRVEPRVDALEAEDTAIEADMERLAGRVSNLALDVEGKVNNGNNTITGAQNTLTVAGENSGDMTTMNGSSFLAQSFFAGSTAVGWTAEQDEHGDPPHIRVFRVGGAAVRISNVAPGTADSDAVNVQQFNARTQPLIVDVVMLTGGSCTVLSPFDNITDAIYNGRAIYARVTASPDDKYTNHVIPATLFRDSGATTGRSIMFHVFSASQYYPVCIIRGYAPNTWTWVERAT